LKGFDADAPLQDAAFGHTNNEDGGMAVDTFAIPEKPVANFG
jgi:hypothetical protein